MNAANASAPVENTTGPEAGLLNLVARIESFIDEETAAIKGNPQYDLKSSNTRKSRYLYELGKAFRALGNSEPSQAVVDAVTNMRERLAINARAIEMHLGAVGEIADLVQDAIEPGHQADGTYSAREFATAAPAGT